MGYRSCIGFSYSSLENFCLKYEIYILLDFCLSLREQLLNPFRKYIFYHYFLIVQINISFKGELNIKQPLIVIFRWSENSRLFLNLLDLPCSSRRKHYKIYFHWKYMFVSKLLHHCLGDLHPQILLAPCIYLPRQVIFMLILPIIKAFHMDEML